MFEAMSCKMYGKSKNYKLQSLGMNVYKSRAQLLYIMSFGGKRLSIREAIRYSR